MKSNIKILQDNINYRFNNSNLLINALTHSSYANEKRLGKEGTNERLEFLGDAVLELVSSEFLFNKYKNMPEGELTKIRAGFVCEKSLNFCAKKIDLGSFILLGKGEEQSGGRNRAVIIADAFEALIGAIYLDSGLASAKEFIYTFVLSDKKAKELFFDSKTILQEEVQKKENEEKGIIEYHLIREFGPEHSKMFEIAVYINSEEYGRGIDTSKKNAEQQAAKQALKKLGKM